MSSRGRLSTSVLGRPNTFTRERTAVISRRKPASHTVESLEAEQRLGLARQCYRESVYAARRREAKRLGYSASDTGADGIDVELAELLAAYVPAVDEGLGPASGEPAEADRHSRARG